ncbi:hypothetical protein GGI04_002451 [Coemansia thaxteri]|uniref:Endonuclease V n=1 Tax=Coemansia thaxteri TaxID=2663907 RepID=A0A9W8BGL0_9FUNG|nr:hypothetical protein H4R26_002408 [Coemansia thaxteri]KAJ2004874.1 hypothetical protein GGI04_002451 [Coemansia thaxteri]KAJ2471879.1 hypothetical protein GGI02_001974 [Coemansia sp. RSA 2322]KAJ2485123.1 hypothetical protein EV174_001934 [Coemansia sp. RSA 2320]
MAHGQDHGGSVGSELVREWEEQQAEMSGRLEELDRLDFVLPRKVGEQDRLDSVVPGSSHPAVRPVLERIGGVDISYPRNSPERAVVALVVLAYPSLEILYDECAEIDITVPYKAGFLAFREMEAYRSAFARLHRSRPELWPQVVLVDGNGTLHPRRFGSACHLGVALGMPTIGVAKNFLHIDGVPADARALKHHFQQPGAPTEVLLRSADAVYGMAVAPAGGDATNPVFVSSGHRVSLRTAVDIVRLCSRHRVPEPIRVADQRSRALAREIEAAHDTAARSLEPK